MKIDEACVGCIINQSVKVADAIKADASLKHQLLSTVEQMSTHFSFEQTPPEIAADVYEKMADIAHRKDLYEEQKQHATTQALSFVPFLEEKLSNTQELLLTATKIAVAGNVIDLAAEVTFDLEHELEKIFHTEFAINDIDRLDKALRDASSVVLLGDNVGEHIFDYLYIKTLKRLYPHIHFAYFVRGVPIINDVTMKEAQEAGFEELCELVDSGVNTPGFTYTRATPYAQKLFDNADLVISKGMGNYECLTPTHRKNICFLLKVKCGVVGLSLKQNIGDIICKLS